MPNTRRGVTFTDLVIVLALLALLMPAVLRTVSRSRSSSERVRCGSNLRQIGQAFLLYSVENGAEYPRTIYKPGSPPTQYTGVYATNPFAIGGPRPNDVTAALYLLARTQDITPEVFVCPSTLATAMNLAGKQPTDFSNFPGEQNLSYSMANPYPDGVSVTTRAPFAPVDAAYAVAADMNPGTGGGYDAALPTLASPLRDMQKGNTRNHQGAGQNVLYADGHVEFQQNAFAGQDRDDIYTVAGSDDGKIATSATIVGTPRWSGDSVMLPVATQDPGSSVVGDSRRSSVLPLAVIGVAAILAVIAVAVAAFVRRRGADAPRV
jgi:prepilin-type processing-associated H-X9-DG protein